MLSRLLHGRVVQLMTARTMLRIFFLALTCISLPIRAYYIDPATGYPVTSPRNAAMQATEKRSFASIFQAAHIPESPTGENGPALITSDTTIPVETLPTTNSLSDAQLAGLAIGGAAGAGAIATKAVVATHKHRKQRGEQNHTQQEPETPTAQSQTTKEQPGDRNGQSIRKFRKQKSARSAPGPRTTRQATA